MQKTVGGAISLRHLFAVALRLPGNVGTAHAIRAFGAESAFLKGFARSSSPIWASTRAFATASSGRPGQSGALAQTSGASESAALLPSQQRYEREINPKRMPARGGGLRSWVSPESWARWLIGDPGSGRAETIRKMFGTYTVRSRRVYAAITVWYHSEGLADSPALAARLNVPEKRRLDFIVRWELLALHMWLLVRRVRVAGGDEKKILDMVMEDFWKETELRLFEDEGMAYMQLSKVVKDLTKLWYSLGLLMDNAIAENKIEEVDRLLQRNITFLDDNPLQAKRVRLYLLSEIERLEALPPDAMLRGRVWVTNASAPPLVDKTIPDKRRSPAIEPNEQPHRLRQ